MELLSPAGSFENLISAVRSGADAIYIGGSAFSARRNAKNFTDDEIVKACDFCHLYGVKLYVAVNILVKESEMKDALSYVEFLIKSGVDGIIIQDIGLISQVRKMSPEIFINASTQMSIGSHRGVNIAKSLGADRVVLARELGIKEIKAIREKTDIELETFVHGALCMSWSGQCLMSSVIGGRSGNRGLCAQPCRLSYTLIENGKKVSENIPLLSLKDICLASELDKLAGVVDSLKIEGRMKSKEYTASVTSLYKKAIMGKITQEEIDKTLSFFSRGGSSKGYFNGRKFDKMMDYTASGKVSAERADVIAVNEEDLSTKTPISMVLDVGVGEKAKLFASALGFETTVYGDVLEEARKEFDDERIKEQLEKLGDTPFVIENITINKSGNPFLPVSLINSLRREVCADLKEQICASFKKSVIPIKEKERFYKKRGVPKLVIEVTTKEQLDACTETGDFEIITGFELSKSVNTPFSMCPAVDKEGEETTIHAGKIMVQNLGQIDDKKELFGGERLNITNSYSCEVARELGIKRITLSPELNIKEIKEIMHSTDVETEVVAYGHLPIMVMENCVIKSQGKCTKLGGNFELLDRMGEKFPIICENCKNIILNSVPIYLADKGEDLLSLNVDAIRLKFTIEDKKTTKAVIKAYQDALMLKTPKGVFSKITRGHFYRGVE